MEIECDSLYLPFLLPINRSGSGFRFVNVCPILCKLAAIRSLMELILTKETCFLFDFLSYNLVFTQLSIR